MQQASVTRTLEILVAHRPRISHGVVEGQIAAVEVGHAKACVMCDV